MKGYNKYKDTPDNHDFMTQDHIAGFLRNHGTGTNNRGRWFLAKILQQYQKPVVVDAACGTAVNYEVFREAGVDIQYIGVDRTEGMLEEAKRRYPEIELRQGYVQDLPLEDDGADVVIMRHILEHLQEGYEDAIREGLRVANKELIVAFFLNPSDTENDEISESDPDENGCTFFWNTYSWSRFAAFIASLGVRIERHYVETPGAAHADTIVRLIK
jgi:ubiquinone/menaquinone biosynthesis C-methylase UbiE